MRLVACHGCGNLMLRGRRWCEDCVAGFRTRDEQLNQGHGALAGVRTVDDHTVPFIMSMRQILDDGRAECEAAVRVALREGARAVTEHHEVPLAAEVRVLEKAADRAAKGLAPSRKERLLAGCDGTLTKPLRGSPARAGTVHGSPRRRREEDRDVHPEGRRELGLQHSR